MASQASHMRPESEAVSTAELIDRLSRFDGPPEVFLVNLLAVQCALVRAEGGTILRTAAQGPPQVLAVYPPLAEGATAPPWLAQSVEAAPEVVASTETIVRPIHGADDLYGQRASRHLVMVPLRTGESVRGLTAYLIPSGDAAVLAAARERLEITVSLLSLYEMRLTLQQRQADFQRVRTAMETLAAVNATERFKGAAMALCNEVAARWAADRVSVGILKGRYVHLKATSHTEKFSRKMKLVQDIEAAMEECLDQDVEIVHPADPQTTSVTRAAGELARRHGPSALVSMPLRQGGEVKAVLTAERPPDKAFDLNEIEALRLTGELCTARLLDLHEHGRWFGARAAAAARRQIATVLGPKHTWIKLAAIGIFAAIVFLIFAKGPYKVQSSFVLEATLQRVVAAPFDGRIEEVLVEPGERVAAGGVLARLQTRELEEQLAKATADWAAADKDYQTAMDQGKGYDRQKAEAAKASAQADMNLLNEMIARAELTSPIDGRVLMGDLAKAIGGPVQTGQELYQIAPLSALRVELAVPEEQIADVIQAKAAADAAGEELAGEMATAARPGAPIRFTIERIIPLAEVVDQHNIFKVRARLLEVDLAGEHDWLRPGMEGVAKVSVGRRRYAWIWTRKLVNWLRMRFW